jgi:PPOX class probable F420-dependent enzyme
LTRTEAIQFIEKQRNGVLTTILKDGRPHSAPIVYAASGETAEISATWDRVKTRNLKRDPRANLCVLPESGWYPYITAEGVCELVEDPGGRLNLGLYRRITGGDPDDVDEYLEAMTREGRHLIRLHIERLYPLDK